jgi:hypothetical protein
MKCASNRQVLALYKNRLERLAMDKHYSLSGSLLGYNKKLFCSPRNLKKATWPGINGVKQILFSTEACVNNFCPL